MSGSILIGKLIKRGTHSSVAVQPTLPFHKEAQVC